MVRGQPVSLHRLRQDCSSHSGGGKEHVEVRRIRLQGALFCNAPPTDRMALAALILIGRRYEKLPNPLRWEGEAPAEPRWIKHLRQGGSPSPTFSHLRLMGDFKVRDKS